MQQLITKGNMLVILNSILNNDTEIDYKNVSTNNNNYYFSMTLFSFWRRPGGG